ncbi:MAG: c-type cytochrome [Cyanobacteria bacterium SZAS LIN-2]|nr:c-type cytochrome [Cyanobacteria bacterium SZAS LIN-2]
MGNKNQTAILSFSVLASLALAAPFCSSCFGQAGEAVRTEGSSVKIISIPSTGYVPKPASKESAQGKKRFEEMNCMACHSIHNVGGDLAPRLDGVGGRRTSASMLARLSNDVPAGKVAPNAPQHSRYTPATAKLLVAYLETIPEPAGGFVIGPHVPRLPAEKPNTGNAEFKPLPVSARSIEGEKMYNKFGCVACHSIGQVGGWFGPPLDGVGARHSRAYIASHVTEARVMAKEPGEVPEETITKMPRFLISADEAQKITEYLLTLPKSQSN